MDKIVATIFLLFVLTSCKKKYACECGDPSGKMNIVFQSYGPKNFTQRRCDTYLDRKVDVRTPETQCSLK